MSDRPPNLSLPDKLYFKIGEVSDIIGVKPYVLRYWETEFNSVKPIRRSSQRLYDKDTIRLFHKIKHLLYEQKFTIAGVRKMLKDERSGSEEGFSARTDKVLLQEVLDELISISEGL